MELYMEYLSSYITENYFEDLFTTFSKARKFFRDVLEIDYDFKVLNHNFGKKNLAKKSQIRTIVEFMAPIFMYTVMIGSVLFGLLLTCCWSVCGGRKDFVDDEKKYD